MNISQIRLQPFESDNDDMNYDKMEEDLMCPICLELYADPLMMPCSHSVCKACLHEIRASRNKLGQTDFECPTCRDKHPLNSEQLEKLPKNLALENIVFRYQEIKSSSLIKKGQACISFNQPSTTAVESEIINESDSVFEEINEDCLCGMCEEESPNRADWFCPQCQVLYCQRCLDLYHPRRGSLGRHRLCKPAYHSAPKNSLPCPEHPEERVSIFCDTCRTIACHLCVCQGQGSHGAHLILDVDTAQKQMRASICKAKEDLMSLISVFTLRDKELESQLEIVKSVKDLAHSRIKSQYQCILADVAATLSLIKQKFSQTLASSLAEHVGRLQSKGRDAKDSLVKCQKLQEACELLMLSFKERESLSSLSNASTLQNEERSSILDQSSLTHDLSGSSFDGSLMDASLIIGDHAGDKPFSVHGGGDETAATRDELNSDGNNVTAKSLVDTIGNVNKNDDKNRTKLSAAEPNHSHMTSTPLSFSNCPRDNSLPNADDSRRQLVAACSDNKKEQDGNYLNKPPLVEERKQSVDRQNSERKQSEKHLDIGDRRQSDLTSVSSVSSACTEKSFEFDERHQLLTQAKSVHPILDEIAALSKELQQSGTFEEEALNEITKTVWASVADYGQTSFSLISELSDAGKEELDIPSIIPPVRSSVSPVSPNQKAVPRVQSRVLLTWGFNSTSFTAEPIAKSAQWTVTIARNTSHIGDVHSGYLFGVGVATRNLASKEQVGMNAHSYGIICYKGSLAFCHNGQVSPIMPLPDLPISIRLSVLCRAKVTVFCYSLMLNASTGAVQGRRVVSLRREDQGDNGDSSSDGGSGTESGEMFPVFTVTQRVKMQFPLTSDV